MGVVTTHNNVDFDGLASIVALQLLNPDVTGILPRHLNPNVKAFLSIHKDLFESRFSRDIDPRAITKLTA